MRNISGRVVDERLRAIASATDIQHMGDRTVYDAMYYDAINDLTVVHSDTTGVMISTGRGR